MQDVCTPLRVFDAQYVNRHLLSGTVPDLALIDWPYRTRMIRGKSNDWWIIQTSQLVQYLKVLRMITDAPVLWNEWFYNRVCSALFLLSPSITHSEQESGEPVSITDWLTSPSSFYCALPWKKKNFLWRGPNSNLGTDSVKRMSRNSHPTTCRVPPLVFEGDALSRVIVFRGTVEWRGRLMNGWRANLKGFGLPGHLNCPTLLKHWHNE